ncbi:serine hydrolase domain-containing protein [Anaeromicropila populeti]|uniref:CubicO group peptidase, beta-lactamase class C family n=1 Tax=Anaeromicropila populeti TaxID=37658 RepID=A0A1I6LBE9_9FIRM|nr:serine hydrolase domain-containing protein [Anaeromicropila populeti]SFS00774.1 CubicO group peptidase, beta-lactamase class C family [Anaeromicropila populeti]
MNTKKLSWLNNLFQKELDEKRVLGASIQIEHKGKTAFHNIYGSDKEDTIYKIFSMTKPITATAIMILAERGLIDLQEPADKYIPGLKNMKVSTKEGLVDAKTRITIQHLLNMTSGIAYPWEEGVPEKGMLDIQQDLLKRMEKGEKIDIVKICNCFAEAPLDFEPGTSWKYGASADFLGAIVQIITGMRYGDFLKQEIFEPLRMVDTDFKVAEEKRPRLAKVYSRADEEGHLVEAPADEPKILRLLQPEENPDIEAGGAGLYSTLEDYIHFVRMLVGKGTFEGRQILGRKTVEYMGKNQLTPEQLKTVYFESIYGYGYGNLMRVMLDTSVAASNGSVGEYGWDGLAGTYFFVDPKEELVMVYMQQILQGGDVSLRRKMRQIIYGALSE